MKYKSINRLTLIMFGTVFCIFIVLLASFSWFKTGETQANQYSVDFENTVWRDNTTCCKWLYDPKNRITFRIPVQGQPDYLESWIEAETVKNNHGSFVAWLKTPPLPKTVDWKKDPNYEKQRIEFEISNSDYNTHHLEETKYYSLNFYIDPRSADRQTKGVVFMQADQSHNTTYPKYPAFFIRFKDNSAYKWEVNVARDESTDTRFTKGTYTTIYSSSECLKKGTWYRLTVMFKPSVEGKGAIKVWLNGNEAVALVNHDFGYTPQHKPWVINDYFWVRFGAYRRPEPDKPGDIMLIFDDIKTGLNISNVDL